MAEFISLRNIMIFVCLVCIAISWGALPAKAATGDMWANVTSAVDNYSLFPSMGILIGSDDLGVVLNYTKGSWSMSTPVSVASASKWMSSTAIWTLIQQGLLSLDDFVYKWIPWWTSNGSDLRSQMRLRDLLSFTSGLWNNTCDSGYTNVTQCVFDIYNNAYNNMTGVPGQSFYYCSDHLQVAGYMAYMASGLTFAQLWNQNVLTPLGISSTNAFFTPIAVPNLAGGLYTSTNTYSKILLDIYTNNSPKLLNSTSRSIREQDFFYPTTSIVYSPVTVGSQTWHYADSFWVMCPYSNATTWNASCGSLEQYSSPGKFGFTPYIDRINNYWMILPTYNIIPAAGVWMAILAEQVAPMVVANLQTLRSPTMPGPSGSPSSPSSSPSPSGASSQQYSFGSIILLVLIALTQQIIV